MDHDTAGLYKGFGLPSSRVLTLDAMRPRRFDMVFCAHTSGFFPRRRCPRVQIFHGVSFRNMAVRDMQRHYDYAFMVGPYMKRAFVRGRIFRRDDPRALEIGFPKLDRLVDGSLDRSRILHDLNLKGDRPVLLYAPTGARFNSMEVMGEEVIARIKAQGRYDLLIKPHDHPKNRIDWFSRLRRFEGPHVKLIHDYDVVPYLFVADLLISDASSVASEYSLLDRPIVFLDVPKVIAAARKKSGMVDLKTYGRKTGVTVRRAADLPEVVRWFLAHPRHRSSVRRAMAKDLFFDPGRATQRAVDWIVNRLGRKLSRRPEAARLVAGAASA
jgi:CDP-glycerol glycerophosphotransferase (TagB/SpsB family)